MLVSDHPSRISDRDARMLSFYNKVGDTSGIYYMHVCTALYIAPPLCMRVRMQLVHVVRIILSYCRYFQPAHQFFEVFFASIITARLWIYKLYTFNQCSNYSKGLVTGELCQPLCLSEEIHFQRCLGHGVKLHVLKAAWREGTVVLKTPKAHKLFARVQVGDVVTKQQFIEEVK